MADANAQGKQVEGRLGPTWLEGEAYFTVLGMLFCSYRDHWLKKVWNNITKFQKSWGDLIGEFVVWGGI
jgi:hypothetical protein